MRRLTLSPSIQRYAPVLQSSQITAILTFAPPPNYPYRQDRFRSYDQYYHSTALKSSPSSPFSVLKIDSKTKYTDAKKSFLKIAMANHPDTLGKDITDKERTSRMRTFQNARAALEALTSDENGFCVLKSEAEETEEFSDAEFDDWFVNETGLTNPFDIDPSTMREIAKATNDQGIGCDRDGGMWQLARMVTEKVNEAEANGGPVENILKLEAGEEGRSENNVEGRVRRRRKRVGNRSNKEGRR